MYLIYIDESYDTEHFVYSALFVDAFQWNFYFDCLMKWRKEWEAKYSIPLEEELHSTDFLAGKKHPSKNRNRGWRAKLFYNAVGYIGAIEGIKILNGHSEKIKRHMLLSHILTCIHQYLDSKNAYGILVCDEGDQNNLITTVRKMKKENRMLKLDTNSNEDINMPVYRIIEDPLFKNSKSSYFIQASDLLAFSLLRNESPLVSTEPLVKNAFEQLDKVLIKESHLQDKKGIVRA